MAGSVIFHETMDYITSEVVKGFLTFSPTRGDRRVGEWGEVRSLAEGAGTFNGGWDEALGEGGLQTTCSTYSLPSLRHFTSSILTKGRA